MQANLLGLRWALIIAIAALVAACGTVPMGTPQASIDNIRAAKSAGIASTAVGKFTVPPGMDSALDSSIGVRATTLTAPKGSFAGYLKETLEAELTGSGLLNPASKLRIDGYVTDRQLDPAMSKGSARLAARFIVNRDGNVVYDRELAVSATWESSFIGAVAIPAAINEFTALFPKIVTKLLSDPDFRTAMKP